MLIRFFKSNQSATFIAIPILVIALWIEGFMKQVPLEINSSMPVYKLAIYFYSAKTAIIYRIIALGLIILQAIYLNNIINKHEVLYKKSHLPALLYCILMSLFIPFLNFTPLLLINILLIKLLDTVLSFYKSTTNDLAFNCGFLMGVCALIYFPSIIIFFLILFGLMILRPFYWRNWVASIIGIILPFYFISIYYFWTDKLEKFWGLEIPGYFIHLIRIDFSFTRPVKILSIAIAFIVLLSLLKLQSNFFKNVIRTRNFQIVLLFFFVISGLSLFLCPKIQLEDFSIIAMPSAIFISYYFLSSKKTILVEFLMLLLLLLLIYNQIVFKP